MNRIQFDEEQNNISTRQVTRSSFARFLLRYGIATSPRMATFLLVTIIIIGVAVTIYNVGKIGTPPPPTLESVVGS